MLPERGPVERSRRSLSTSGNDGDKIQDGDKKPAQGDASSTTTTQHASQEEPRRCEEPLRSSTPASEPLSREASSASTASTPTPEPVATRHSSRHSLSHRKSSPVEPPVTKSTLSELDVSKIIHNPKLRHDINFDPELHFRPNLDGEKGRKKQDRASQFWRTLKEELTEFITDRPSFYAKHGEADNWTLPALLKAVKEIIHTLVPQRDRQFLDEGLNVELLMQQFHKGIADLEKLALWLSQVLKSHCAPMRDDWVDTMYTQLSEGNRNLDLDQLVTGMRSLLSVLEAMKLDVANHQIRCLRPVLIEDTPHFEQKFFSKKIESGKVEIAGAREWYKKAESQYSGNTSQALGDMSVFFEGLSRLVLPSSTDKRVPSTFLFDEERIVRLRCDLLDAINLDICMRMFEDLERVGRFSARMASRAAEEEGSRAGSPSSDFNFNTPLNNSRPSSLAFSSAGSATSSPRSSFAMPTYVAPEQSESRIKAKELYNSLVSLLQSAPQTSRPTSRWKMMTSSIALQIFRYTDAPSEMLPAFEEKLSQTLSRRDAQMYREVEESYHSRLMAELATRVREFKALSGLCLFSVATGGRVSSSGVPTVQSSRGTDAHEDGSFEDVATRLAHLGVLHWRVWAQLAYISPESDDVDMEQPADEI